MNCCPTCNTKNSGASDSLELKACADLACLNRICPCCSQFVCDACAETFCSEHLVFTPDSTRFCAACAEESVRQQNAATVSFGDCLEAKTADLLDALAAKLCMRDSLVSEVAEFQSSWDALGVSKDSIRDWQDRISHLMGKLKQAHQQLALARPQPMPVRSERRAAGAVQVSA